LVQVRVLAEWIGLPDHDWSIVPEVRRVISTSSAWQARQPVHARSVGRWKAYAEVLPELLAFDE
jgi:hypothetical protein